MDWVDGLSVAEILSAARTSNAMLTETSRRAGAWLAAFHRLNTDGFAATDTGLLLSRLERVRAQAGGWLDDKIFHRSVWELRRTVSAVELIKLPVAWRHGDCKAQNLMVTGAGEFFAIDLEVQDRDVVAADLAKFIGDVEFLSWHPRAWRLRRRRKLIMTSAVDGYTAGNSASMALPLAWLRLHRLLSLWLEFEITAKSSLRDFYQRYRFKKATQAVCGDLIRLSDKYLGA
jgi:aminoglycoside phosphotransferase (APT) family kinase protein